MFLLSEHNIKKEHNGNRERGTFCIYALLSWPSGIRGEGGGNLYKSSLLALRNGHHHGIYFDLILLLTDGTVGKAIHSLASSENKEMFAVTTL